MPGNWPAFCAAPVSRVTLGLRRSFMLLAGEGCPYLVELLPSGLRVPKPEPASSLKPSGLHVARGEFSGSGAGVRRGSGGITFAVRNEVTMRNL
jgi:hypothetical protein